MLLSLDIYYWQLFICAPFLDALDLILGHVLLYADVLAGSEILNMELKAVVRLEKTLGLVRKDMVYIGLELLIRNLGQLLDLSLAFLTLELDAVSADRARLEVS